MITSYLTHPDIALHDMGSHHPESPMRLEAIRARLMLSGLLQQTMQSEPGPATRLQLERVHAPDYLSALEAQRPQSGLQQLDSDTRMGPYSLEAAALGAGAAIRGVDLVCGNRADNVFCAMRPPGHHAEAEEAIGFCFYNSVARRSPTPDPEATLSLGPDPDPSPSPNRKREAGPEPGQVAVAAAEALASRRDPNPNPNPNLNLN